MGDGADAQQIDSDVVFDFGENGQVKVTKTNEAAFPSNDFLL